MRAALIVLLVFCAIVKADDLSLVRQLGDASFSARENAYQKLLARGASARSALEIGVAVADPEVRIRCRELLSRIVNSQLDARMKAFLDGQTDLPGWQRYREAIPNAQRDRFLDLHRAQGGLFEALERDPREARERLLTVSREMKERFLASPKSVQAAEVPALLLTASDARVRLDDADCKIVLDAADTVALWRSVREKLVEDVAARTALIEFANRLTDASARSTMLTVFFKLELRDGLPFARRCLTGAPASPTARAAALMLLGKLGDKNDLPAVTACLADSGVVGQRQLRTTQLSTQVRDVALAMAVHLSGAEPASYGFPYLQTLPSPLFSYQPTCFGFANANDRSAAHERWAKRSP